MLSKALDEGNKRDLITIMVEYYKAHPMGLTTNKCVIGRI